MGPVILKVLPLILSYVLCLRRGGLTALLRGFCSREPVGGFCRGNDYQVTMKSLLLRIISCIKFGLYCKKCFYM